MLRWRPLHGELPKLSPPSLSRRVIGSQKALSIHLSIQFSELEASISEFHRKVFSYKALHSSRIANAVHFLLAPISILIAFLEKVNNFLRRSFPLRFSIPRSLAEVYPASDSFLALNLSLGRHILTVTFAENLTQALSDWLGAYHAQATSLLAQLIPALLTFDVRELVFDCHVIFIVARRSLPIAYNLQSSLHAKPQ